MRGQVYAKLGHQNFVTSCSFLKLTELQLTDTQLVKIKQLNSCICSLWNLKFSVVLQKHSSNPLPQHSPKEMVGKILNWASNPRTQHLPQTTMTMIPLFLNNVKYRLYCILHCLVLREKHQPKNLVHTTLILPAPLRPTTC